MVAKSSTKDKAHRFDDFRESVLKANPDLTFVVSAHLFVESLLVEWLASILPKPKKLFADYRPSFQQIVALCQALDIVEDDLALVIKKLNTLRNKFSHNLKYQPDSATIEDFLDALRKMKHPFYTSFAEPTERELARALASLCGYLQLQVGDFVTSKARPT